jgi:hypothetical protein
MRWIGWLAVSVLLSAGPARAEQWFVVDSPEINPGLPAIVETDLETLHTRGAAVDGVIRVTHQEQRMHSGGFSYRSFVATTQIDCQHRLMALTSAAYFSDAGGKGQRVGADSAGREGGMPPWLIESIPAAARRALLRASCANMAAN